MPRILIVDDEDENRDELKMFLADENPDWQFFTASGEEAALATIKQQDALGQPLDVILTDLWMDTEQSGMRIIQAAREADPFAMIILFTGKEHVLDRYKAFESGAFDVVDKISLGGTASKEISIKTRAAVQYRDLSRQLFFLRRYFDPRVLQTVQRDKGLLALKNRTVSVVFWDIRGFSKLCEILKEHPELIADFLKDYCELAARTIFARNGILDKFIGDGVMALFGVLDDTAKDAGRADAVAAVNAAIDLRDAVNKLIAVSIEKWRLYTAQVIEIGLGCGIHTGDALVGNVGTEFRDQFTALGPHVNLAARIEARSSSSQILISQSTEARVKAAFKLSRSSEVSDIKNVPGTFVLYSVDGPK